MSHPLPSETLIKINQVCDAYEDSWQSSQRPQMEAFLEGWEGEERAVLFRHLVELDWEYVHQEERMQVIADYRSRFPDLADDLDTLVDRPSDTQLRSAAGSSPPGGAEQQDLLSVGADFGRYRILQRIGTGGMGQVYLAEDSVLARRVALKVPKVDAAGERFIREAQAAAALQHPHICPVHDLGVHDGVYFISMSYLEGRPLSDRAADGQLLDQYTAAAIIQKLSLALAEAHRQGVIHRDIKPSNIMLAPNGDPVIMDFGLARTDHLGDAPLTRSGEVMGTVAYMSPEQAAGDVQQLGPAADVYSLGVLFYELLCGRPPFQGNMATMFVEILTVEPPPPSHWQPHVDARLEQICLKMIAKQTKDRLPSMQVVNEELQKVLADHKPLPPETIATQSSAETTQVNPAAKPARAPATTELPPAAVTPRPVAAYGGGKRRLPLVAVGAVLLLLVLSGIVMLIRTNEGTLRVEIFDPDVRVQVEGENVILSQDGEQEIRLTPGKRQMTVRRGDFEFGAATFSLRRKQQLVVQVAVVETGDIVLKDRETGQELAMLSGPPTPAAPATPVTAAAPPTTAAPPTPEATVSTATAELAISTGDHRLWAEQLFKLGHMRAIRFGSRSVSKVEDLPDGPLRVTHVNMRVNSHPDCLRTLKLLAAGPHCGYLVFNLEKAEHSALLTQGPKRPDINVQCGDVSGDFSGLAELTWLEDFGTAHTAGDAMFEHLGKLPNLKTVRARICPIHKASVRKLLAAPQLTKLHLSGIPTDLDDSFFGELADSRIEDLYVLSPYLTEAVWDHVAKATQLKKLELSSPQLTGDGVTRLPRGRRFDELCVPVTKASMQWIAENLDIGQWVVTGVSNEEYWPEPLRGNPSPPVTDDWLPPLYKMKPLERLVVEHTKVTPAAIEKLKQHRPNLKVEYTKAK